MIYANRCSWPSSLERTLIPAFLSTDTAMQLASALENAGTCDAGIQIGTDSLPRCFVAPRDDCLSQSDIDVAVATVSSFADTSLGFYSFEAANSVAQGCFALCVWPSG